MRTLVYATFVGALVVVLGACQKEEPPEVNHFSYGVEPHFPFSGEVAGQEFAFFLRQVDLWTMVGHTGYYHVWISDYELNTTTEADGSFRFKFEFPLEANVYNAFQPGYIGDGLDDYYWNLCLIVPQPGTTGMAHYGAQYRVTADMPIRSRSEDAASGPRILERSPVMLDHFGYPYFEVRIRFELAVSRTDLPLEAAYLLNAEGLFRVPIEEEPG